MASSFVRPLLNSLSFGLTSGIITAIGMVVGLESATESKLAIVAGIFVLAVADGLADAAGWHLADEAEAEEGKLKHSTKEIWFTTVFTFLVEIIFITLFAIPILLFEMNTAVIVSVLFGVSLLVILNIYIAKIRKKNAIEVVTEHLLLASAVVFISYVTGKLVSFALK